MKTVVRTDSYQADLAAIESEIAKDKPMAKADMWFHIDDQVEQLADPNFPRKWFMRDSSGQKPKSVVISDDFMLAKPSNSVPLMLR